MKGTVVESRPFHGQIKSEGKMPVTVEFDTNEYHSACLRNWDDLMKYKPESHPSECVCGSYMGVVGEDGEYYTLP